MTSRRRARAFAVLFTAGLALLGLAATEASLRIFLPRWFAPDARRADETAAWRRDDRLGWSIEPNAAVVFTNGLFRGEATFDEDGVRRNAKAGTRLEDAMTIFLIGNSTAAALEVDDDETPAARLEAGLRARGRRCNVANLGVRGYGLDQSALRAIELADRLQPTEIVYLFTNNDLFDANVLHQPGRRFGKGVFVRWDGEREFVVQNVPVPRYPENAVGIVVLDADCRPVVHEGIWSPAPAAPERPLDRIRGALGRNVLLYRALGMAHERIWPDRSADPAIDPHRMISDGLVWDDAFAVAYHDRGAALRRCPEYFESQAGHLLKMLREIDGLKRVLVVLFPDPDRVADREIRASSESLRLFERLEQDGVVDGLLDLSAAMAEQSIAYEDFDCPGDPHFCEEGNAWIAREIERAFYADGVVSRRAGEAMPPR
jgi:hypothetical protein